MTTLVENLRALARHEHSDLTVAAEAADEIERLHADRAGKATLGPAPFDVTMVERHLQEYVDGSSDKTLTETALSIIASITNPCVKIFDHKWLDPECVESGCQSLVLKSLYEAAVKGRQDFRQALRDERRAADNSLPKRFCAECDFSTHDQDVTVCPNCGGAV